MSKVIVDIKNLQRFRSDIQRDLRGSGNGPIRVALRQWAEVYRSFIKERFDVFSKGGGDWPPHSPKTIAKRRKGGGEGLVATLLRDTNTMYKATEPTFSGKPGQLQEEVPFGIRVGFGGPGGHPGGNFTVADLAAWHNFGEGHLPERRIIVDPDRPTIKQMSEIMETALKRMVEK